MVLGVDEQESPHHAAAARRRRPRRACPWSWPTCTRPCRRWWRGCGTGPRQARVAYVMTDGGALPLAFSRTVSMLVDAGWLASTVTVGQAFGGDHEAVNVHTGLLAAAHVVRADVAVVAQGPGNLGTGTRWGFSGTSAGEAVNAAATLGGRRGGLAADLRGRRPGAAPGRVAPQPHRLRAGGPGTGGRARAAAARGVRRAGPRSRRRPWSTPAAAGCGCTRSRSTASTRRWPSAPSGSRRWAAGWTRTGPRSWPRRPPAGTRRPCSDPPYAAGPAPPAPSGGPDAVPRTHEEPVPAPEGLERALRGVRCADAQRTSTRSTTKIRVSPGLIAPPAPRSP